MTTTEASPSPVPLVRVFPDRRQLGISAAHAIARELRSRLAHQPEVRVVFAAAPSQEEMLQALAAEPDLDWQRVVAFHMDEYIGLPQGASQSFYQWLRVTLFDRVSVGRVHALVPDDDPEVCTREYAALLAAAPIDLVCLGIGVNGHLAFNDPPVADLADSLAVKVVELDEVCRQQQVDDGCFATLAEVPTRAVTLTIPRLLAADRLVCVVPGGRKRDAVRRALQDPVGAACPATALRTHPNCSIYLDAESNPEGELSIDA